MRCVEKKREVCFVDSAGQNVGHGGVVRIGVHVRDDRSDIELLTANLCRSADWKMVDRALTNQLVFQLNSRTSNLSIAYHDRQHDRPRPVDLIVALDGAPVDDFSHNVSSFVLRRDGHVSGFPEAQGGSCRLLGGAELWLRSEVLSASPRP